MTQTATATATALEFVRPLPRAWRGLVWGWMCAAPEGNFDDYSPQTEREFCDVMDERARDERTWGVRADGVPIGAIAYRPLTPRVGVLHGVCFDPAVQGTGVSARALRAVLEELYGDGVEKVCAYVFADHARVQRFLEKLGFVTEGVQVAQTLRGGQPVDLRLLAVFAAGKAA